MKNRIGYYYKKYLKQKNAQAFGIDLAVALSIFFIGIIIFYTYAINYKNDSQESLKLLDRDADIILASILSEGYPLDWNQGNVIQIGILSNDKINNTKLEKFYNFTKTDYNRTKSIFNTKYNYYLSFGNDMSIGGNIVEGFGMNGFDKNNIDGENIIKKIRYSIYNNNPETIYLYVWEK